MIAQELSSPPRTGREASPDQPTPPSDGLKRVLDLCAGLAVAVVALGLLQGSLTVPQAGTRIGIAVLALVAVDRLVLPVFRLLVGEPAHAPRPVPRPEQPVA